ncbi:MFS transporter [Alicyclobacillaceae bacterium I2511]|nr:MFS transporter [Alicyclobacillaceae bacterium I2511]
MSSIATGWVSMPKSLQSLLLAWSPIWLIIGIAVAGPLSDVMGRKNTFYLTMSLYGLGAIGLVFSSTYLWILVFLALMLFAAGGEMNTIMAASHEVMPHKHRSKTMFMELNFINLGGMLLAAVSLFSISNSVSFQRGMVAIAFLVVLAILFVMRKNTPESIRWLERKGMTKRAQAEIAKYYGEVEYQARQEAARMATEAAERQDNGHPRNPSTFLKLFVTITISFAGSAGFGLMTYVLGPSYFKPFTAWIILVATGVGFFSGFLGLWADRWSRKNLLLLGYGGTFLMTVLIYGTVGSWTKNMSFFWVLLVALNLFVNIGYLTEDTLKAEVWPTKVRGTLTAIVRFVSIGLYIVTIYMSQHYSLSQYMLFNLVVWAIGLAGALAWYWRGIETGRGTSLDTASGER